MARMAHLHLVIDETDWRGRTPTVDMRATGPDEKRCSSVGSDLLARPYTLGVASRKKSAFASAKRRAGVAEHPRYVRCGTVAAVTRRSFDHQDDHAARHILDVADERGLIKAGSSRRVYLTQPSTSRC
jgi:hypothetical protein